VQLREAAAQTLIAAETIAGRNVFTTRSLPIAADALPALYLSTFEDRGESIGRGSPAFTRTATLSIRGFVSGGTPEAVQAALDVLAEQIEMTIMCDPSFQAKIQQVSEFATQGVVKSDQNEHLGELRILLGLEYFQSYEPAGVPLSKINATIATAANLNFATASVAFPESETPDEG